ncbi:MULTISPECIES: sensor histidine kinase [unclassified Chryseobacterium]|uniref:sensor histidine kinase n=1 Tax=unclassified Chryseobacterium TaxID=2593645 RepID=UPI00285337C5|nr:histidine kinase [Chryseobacterium sp. CFS7]MDR4890709.1 histidine kinase [Chryseobacterium sp. CFS7]
MHHYLLILFLLFHSLLMYSQKPQLRHYSLSDGLPSNTVYSVYQDSKGFIWFCTSWGISRFDGHHFETITSNHGLPDNETFQAWEDEWQRLWVSTYNGSPTYIYNGKVYSAQNDKLCRLMEKRKIGFYDIAPRWSPYADQQKKYSIGKNNISNPQDSTAQSPYMHFFDQGNEYYISTKSIIRKNHPGSTLIYTFKEKAVRPYFYFKDHMYVKNVNVLYDIVIKENKAVVKRIEMPSNILDVTIGKNDKIWICTTSGILEYDPYRSTNQNPRYIAMKGIVSYSSFIDKQGNSWYPTNEGVYMQPTNKTLVYTTADGLIDNNVLIVKYLPGGKLLAGYNNSAVMIREKNSFKPLYTLGDGQWNRLRYILPIDDHIFLAGTDRGLYQCSLNGNQYTKLLEYSQKSAAIRNNTILLSQTETKPRNHLLYDLKEGKFSQLPELKISIAAPATAIDAKGMYWLGTIQGLFYYNQSLKKFIQDHSLGKNRITSLNFLKGRLVISTHSDGIFIRDGQKVIKLNTTNGLISNICEKAYIDERERLWINTDKGLSRVTFDDRMHYSIYHFSAADGVPSHMINNITFGEGKAFLATSNGIIVINQDHVSKSQPYKVYFLKASFKDSIVYYPKKISLKYNQNNAQISYTAISYLDEKDIKYKYLLSGAENDTVITEESTLNLGALKPGNYQLNVWASGKNNSWNKTPAVLAITVKPPFWEELWFMGGIFLLLLILIIVIYRHRINIIRKKEAEKTERKKMIAELEMQALRAQINPHFIFNVLNAIQNYYGKEDELNANYYMAAFSDLIRKTLTHSKEHWNTIEKEMAMLKTYIELEQMRFKNHFTYEISVEPGLEQLKIPTMLLQTYTENSISHGLRHLKTGGILQISCSRSEDSIICIVEDNGVGFEKAREFDSRPDDYKSMGLKITAGRISAINELYGTSISTEITDKKSINPDVQGTIVKITIKNTPFL